jgi:hypothetical protein
VDLATDERALLCKLYARLLLTQQRPQEAPDLLTCIVRWEQMAGRCGHLVSTCILLALAHQALGDSEQAQASLERAVGLAACEEERRVFLAVHLRPCNTQQSSEPPSALSPSFPHPPATFPPRVWRQF